MYYKSVKEKVRLIELMEEVYDDPFWSLGKKTEMAEDLCRRNIFFNTKNTLLVNDGTHALELCLRDINVAGKKVLMPVMTVPMVGWAIESAGGTPVYVDVNHEHMQMDFKAMQEAYNFHGDEIAAVLIVHTGGLITPDIFKIVEWCKERSLPLVEDISHAQLSYLSKKVQVPEYGGDVPPLRHHAGTFGDYAAFSMYATKVVSAGEGGFAAKRGDITGMKAIRNQGKNDKQEWVRKGYNFRASEWTACVAIAKLENIEHEIKHRWSMAKMYLSEGIKGLHDDSSIYWEYNMFPSFYKYIVPKHQRIEGSLTYKSGAVHREILSVDSYPGAEEASKFHICLPLNDKKIVSHTIQELILGRKIDVKGV
jgi:perosamine synthetase